MSRNPHLPPMSFPVEVDGVSFVWPTAMTGRLVEIWEPLSTKAPNPNLTIPFCCYANTVIFYCRPYTLRQHHHFYRWSDGWHVEKPGGSYEEWDRVDTLIHWHSDVRIFDTRLEVNGGTVCWRFKRWWMARLLRWPAKVPDQFRVELEKEKAHGN